MSKGVATSSTTPYNPQGNGQVERYNGIIWKTVRLALRSRNMDTSHWEKVLLESLSSIRSLLCMTINCTPHERMFIHPRNSTSMTNLPSWLINAKEAWMKTFVRRSKHDPEVEKVEIIHLNPHVTQVRLSDGREVSVNIRRLAPVGSTTGREE